ncbi:MAG: hypothetical protein WC538_17365 [Thermoanaerobaculia bacterium]
MSGDNSGSDFVAAGTGGDQPVLRFHWTVDNETLKDVNRASGMDTAVSHLRGFLTKLIAVWLDAPPTRRPMLEIPTVMSEDLVYIPSPCYVFAISADRDTLHCWYSVLVDASPEELLTGRAGVRMFTVTGTPEIISAFLDETVRLFRFRSKSKHQGFTVHKRL